MADDLKADLVLEGGGVKGIAHVGALSALEQAGYAFHRVAGTSAGSIAAAIVAACMATGKKVADVAGELMTSHLVRQSIDYSKVPDGDVPVPVLDDAQAIARLVTHYGLHPGDYLHRWIGDALEWIGVRTFGDLVLDDPRDDLPDRGRYRLVVVTADVSRGSVVRLPWDYGLYALDPDRQPIADAVRASASIPFFFVPQKLAWGRGSRNTSYLVDGGTCSLFPIEIFDRLDDEQERWPTFGIKLSARAPDRALRNNVDSLVSLALATLETAVNGNDQVHLADPCVVERTIFVDTSAVGAEDFDLSPAQQRLLFSAGQAAATGFLSTWDLNAYGTRCQGDVARLERARAARGRVPSGVFPPTGV